MSDLTFIKEIIDIEWGMFTAVQNIGGRASCQDNRKTFDLMRRAQFEAWDDAALACYRRDLDNALSCGRNIVAEKYGYMMEWSDPEGFAAIADQLPAADPARQRLVDEVLAVFVREAGVLIEKYPKFFKRSRPLHRSQDRRSFVSMETYMMGELKTYSEETLLALLSHMKKQEAQGSSFVFEINNNTAKLYGYKGLADAESKLNR